MLGPQLTPENHEAVLARASHAALEDIRVLIAELAPRPDVAASVRKLPVPGGTSPEAAQAAPTLEFGARKGPSLEFDVPLARGLEGRAPLEPAPRLDSAAIPEPAKETGSADATATPRPLSRPTQRPIVQPLAPERYRLQCTIGQETRDKLRRLQALLRREIPDGDPAAIIDRAFDQLLEQVEKAKLGKATKPPRPAAESGPSSESMASNQRGTSTSLPPAAYETRIRFKTDPRGADGRPGGSSRRGSRHLPNAVKSAVWRRDGGQCAFVAPGTGRRCSERSFLEFHHIHPYALDGPATVGNISLRCRGHNQYEGELVFGPRDIPTVREARTSYSSG